jgi:hypothetical protein
MKNTITILIMLVIATLAIAQPPRDGKVDEEHRGGMNDKIKALAVAHITEQLNMDSKEAQRFWPVYNKIKGEHKQLEREKRDLLKKLEGAFDNLGEAQAQEYVSQLVKLEEKIYNSSLEARHNELIEILGAKRYLQLKKAEMDFRSKMIKEFKKRHPREE